MNLHLSNDEQESIRKTIDEFATKVPWWLVNRQRDLETNEDAHIIATEVKLTKDDDIARLAEMKTYRGMASVEAQIDWRGHTSSVEGVASTVDYKGPVQSVLTDITRGVKSGLSYSGARTIREFQARSQMIRITSSGMAESRTHILNT